MDNFDALLAATHDDYQARIEQHPLIALVLNGDITREHYISYLRETYHMVRHTPRMLSLAGARLDDSYRDLRDWFFEQVQEENNHDLFCVKDLTNLGEDAERVLSVPPQRGSWGLVAQEYYMAAHGNPVGVLGIASLTEGLGAAAGNLIADALVTRHGLDRGQVTFIKSHAGLDARHVDDVKRAVNNLLHDNGDLAEVIEGRRMTIHNYSQMFDDVLAAA